jgi:hypothetical protein
MRNLKPIINIYFIFYRARVISLMIMYSRRETKITTISQTYLKLRKSVAKDKTDLLQKNIIILNLPRILDNYQGSNWKSVLNKEIFQNIRSSKIKIKNMWRISFSFPISINGLLSIFS